MIPSRIIHNNPYFVAIAVNLLVIRETPPSPSHTVALFFIHSPLLHSFPYSQSRHISSTCTSVTSRLPCAILYIQRHVEFPFLHYVTWDVTATVNFVLLPFKLYLAFFIFTARQRPTLFPQTAPYRTSLNSVSGPLCLKYSFGWGIIWTSILAWGNKVRSWALYFKNCYRLQTYASLCYAFFVL